jgi:hypothetical protein
LRRGKLWEWEMRVGVALRFLDLIGLKGLLFLSHKLVIGPSLCESAFSYSKKILGIINFKKRKGWFWHTALEV